MQRCAFVDVVIVIIFVVTEFRSTWKAETTTEVCTVSSLYCGERSHYQYCFNGMLCWVLLLLRRGKKLGKKIGLCSVFGSWCFVSKMQHTVFEHYFYFVLCSRTPWLAILVS